MGHPSMLLWMDTALGIADFERLLGVSLSNTHIPTPHSTMAQIAGLKIGYYLPDDAIAAGRVKRIHRWTICLKVCSSPRWMELQHGLIFSLTKLVSEHEDPKAVLLCELDTGDVLFYLGEDGIMRVERTARGRIASYLYPFEDECRFDDLRELGAQMPCDSADDR